MTTRLALIVAIVSTSAFVECISPASAGSVRAVSTREVTAFVAPLKLTEVERRFGAWTPVHGGASVYPCADKMGAEIWFVWAIPKKPSDMRKLSDARIEFVALSRGTKFVKILWPAGITVDEASEKNHKDLEELQRRYPDAD